MAAGAAPVRAFGGDAAPGTYTPADYTPPVMPDCMGAKFLNPEVDDPEHNPELPYRLDRDLGVTRLTYVRGKLEGKQVILPHLARTLEWVVPSPPPLHCFDESPIVKEHPEEWSEVSYDYDSL